MPKVLGGVETRQHHGISCVENSPPPSEGEKKEMFFWRTDEVESPEGSFFDGLVHKASFITTFRKLMHHLSLTGHETVLEMGGGQCWASVLIKKKHPNCYVVASDLSHDAVYSSQKYEDALGISIDEKWAFNSRSIPFEDGQFDRVFTFAAFHHFGEGGDFGESFREMVRVLKPGGSIVLLYEPSSPGWIRKLYRKRMNRVYDYYSKIADEDSLVPSDMRRMCKRLGCRVEVEYYPSYKERASILATLYYFALTKLGFLRSVLPCPVNMKIEKTK